MSSADVPAEAPQQEGTRASDRRARATAMSAHDRRAAIVAAALPLLERRGSEATTAEIAAAAGIAEGTVFRVFEDKSELLTTCLLTASDSTQLCANIAALPRGQPVDQLLEQVAVEVSGHLERISGVFSALRPVLDKSRHPAGKQTQQQLLRSVTAIIEAIAELLRNGQDDLRFSPEVVAQMFVDLLFGAARMAPPGTAATTTTSQVIELFVHGAVLPNPTRKALVDE